MSPLPTGHTFTMRLRVTAAMTARFFECEIHPLYATFAAVEHAEYAARCAIRSAVEPHQDAIGLAVELEHRAPAAVGTLLTIAATVERLEGRDIWCAVAITAADGREIARGRTGQRVISREKRDQLVRAGEGKGREGEREKEEPG
jgi:predicted thioesterase